MRKNIFGTIFIAVLAIAAISCQKSMDESGPTAGNDGTIEIKVNAAMGQYNPAETTKAERVAVTRVSWKGGETVYVYDGKKYLGSLKATLDGTEDRYALLSTDATHTVAKPADGTTKLTLVYSPLLTVAPAVSGEEISISLAKQTGATAPFVIYATLDYNDAETVSITNTVVPFKLATSLITVNCSGLGPRKAIKYAKLENVNTVCKLSLSGTAAPTIAGDMNGSIFRTGDTYFKAENVNPDGGAIFQIAAPIFETTSEARNLTMVQGARNFVYKYFPKKFLPAATSVNTLCPMEEMPTRLFGVFSISATKKVYFSPGNLYGDNRAFKFETKQYDFNKSCSEDHVSHFFWSKNASKACSYYYSDPDRASNDVFFTNAAGFTVNVDGKTLEGWRTLSSSEWGYLLENHSKKWVTVGGVTGLVIAPDGFAGTLSTSYTDDVALAIDNLVFLPAAGSRQHDDKVEGIGEIGNYWSSSVENENYAWNTFFDSFPIPPRYNKTDRDMGISVRLVTDVK